MTRPSNVESYIPNNISFRIAASKFIEDFKQTQTFVLQEVEFGDYPFSRTAKEVILLYSDTVFKWILSLERKIIRETYDSPLTAKNKEYILSSFIEYTTYIDEVINAYPDIFNRKLCDVWREIRFDVCKKIKVECQKAPTLNLISFFAACATIIIESLDELRLDLYEIDYLSHKGEHPFICVTDSSFKYSDEGTDRLINKAKVYHSFFGVSDLRLKDFSNSPSYFLRYKNDVVPKIKNILEKKNELK